MDFFYSRYGWQLFFNGGNGYPDIQLDSTNMGGLNTGMAAVHTVQGGLEMAPIRGDFLRTAHSTPQVSFHIPSLR